MFWDCRINCFFVNFFFADTLWLPNMWQAHDMFVDMFLPSWVTRFKHRRTVIGYFLCLGTHLPPKPSVLTWAQFDRLRLFTWHTLALVDGRRAGATPEIPSYRVNIFLYPRVSIMQLGSRKFSNNLAVFPSWQTWEELHAVMKSPSLCSSLFTIFSHPLLSSEGSWKCLSRALHVPLVSWRERPFRSEPPAESLRHTTPAPSPSFSPNLKNRV